MVAIGIGDALAGDIGGRAMYRLIERAAASVGIGGAERGRRQHAERAGEHRRLVGEHVAEQIVGDDDIECLGIRTSCMAQLSARMW